MFTKKGCGVLEFDTKEYISRIKAHYHLLSDGEIKVADYFLKNDFTTFNDSIHKLGQEIQVSPATIIKCCKSLGFKGFTEFKYYLQRGIVSPMGGCVSIGSDDTAAQVGQKVSEYAKSTINDMERIIDYENLEKAISILSDAKRIIIVGEGSSGGIAMTAAITFSNLGLQCEYVSDAFAQIISASYLTNADAAIGISNGGFVKNTVDALQIAKQQHATTICITGCVNSPITKHSDIVLYTSSKSASSVHDLPIINVSQLVLISMIQTGILIRNYDKLQTNIKRIRDAVKLKNLHKL
ncbi:MAG: MurR/RpiR family transcriptional regulator [Acetivibrionales bacterium]